MSKHNIALEEFDNCLRTYASYILRTKQNIDLHELMNERIAVDNVYFLHDVFVFRVVDREDGRNRNQGDTNPNYNVLIITTDSCYSTSAEVHLQYLLDYLESVRQPLQEAIAELELETLISITWSPAGQGGLMLSPEIMRRISEFSDDLRFKYLDIGESIDDFTN